MSKKNKKAAAATPAIKQTPVPAPPKQSFAFTSFKVQAIILAIICCIFYGNTIYNEYALDDELVITKNEYVHNGITGIHDILTTDAYESYSKQVNGQNTLSGGRYRPLSIVTFAIEQEMFGKSSDYIQAGQADKTQPDMHLAHIRHFVNLLLYILCVIALLYLFRRIAFPTHPLLSLFTAILFTIHPIHTEVVANIKSRDELLSLLFITITLIELWRYSKSGKIKDLIIALSTYFLALLSKEYAVTLLVLIPIMFYVYQKCSIAKSIRLVLPFAGVFIVYALLRFSIVPLHADESAQDILNNPYLFATATEKLATIIATQLNYIWLLFLPISLSSDYSYNQIPYTTFADPKVWLSLLVYAGLFIIMLQYLYKQKKITFAYAFFLTNWLIVSNLLFSIGATMGERLIFHASVGFIIIIAFLLYKLYERIPTALQKPVSITGILILIFLCGFRTIERNTDWKNNVTLFAKDIQVSPNSAALNSNVGTNYAMESEKTTDSTKRDELLKKAFSYWTKATEIYPRHVLARANLASYYMRYGQYDLAIQNLDTIRRYYPAFPNLNYIYSDCYFNNALKNYAPKGMYTQAITDLLKAVQEEPNNPRNLYYLGSYYATLNQYDKSLDVLYTARKYSPNAPPLEKLIDSIQRLSTHAK